MPPLEPTHAASQTMPDSRAMSRDAFRARQQRERAFVAPVAAVQQSPWLERVLVALTIMIMPLEAQIPNIGGFSIMALMFGVLLVYTVLFRLGGLLKMAGHPVFLISYLLLLTGYVMETGHPTPSDGELMRIAQMVFGGVLVAALCQHRSTLRAALYGYIIAGSWLSFMLLVTSYGALRSVKSATFMAASLLRARVFEDSPLHNNLNTIAFVAAQGATVALAWALTATTTKTRQLFFTLTLLCSLGAFLPLSRSGILMLVVSLLVVLLTYRGNRSRALSMMIFLGISLMVLSPDAAFSRLSFTTATTNGRMEGRARIYTAAIQHFPDYVVQGVGAGNFWDSWGKANGFGDFGAHNSFIQVTIYWGLPALFMLLAVVWRAYRCLPKTNRDDALVLALYGISMSLILRMLTSHNLYAKEFALGLGLLAAVRYSLPQDENAAPRVENGLLRAPVALPPSRRFND